MPDNPDPPKDEAQKANGGEAQDEAKTKDVDKQETGGQKPHLAEQDPHRPKWMDESSAEDWLGTNKDPDVLLSIPDLGIDRINVDVEDLEAHVNLDAQVLDIVKLRVGAHVTIKKVEIDIQNVHAAAMLKVNLQPVVNIVQLLVEHPDFLGQVVQGLRSGGEATQIGQGDDDDFDVNDTSMHRAEEKDEAHAIEARTEESHEEKEDDKPDNDPGEPKQDDEPKQDEQPTDTKEQG